MKEKTKFLELKKIFDILHSPKGCLWDKEQTHKSLLPYLKEEAQEFVEAVKKNDFKHMQEELGDLLIQVMFHSKIAAKSGKFDVEDVIDGLIQKLKRRHPHVFGDTKVGSAKEIIANWQKIKRMEKRHGKKKI
jgi:tetrapyrrole methylase family protein/MazG family protein